MVSQYPVIAKLKNNNEYWIKVMDWFEKYKCKDGGMQFIWDSIFTDKYLQSIHMMNGMLKHILYLYRSIKEPKKFPYTYSSDRVNLITNFFKDNYKLTEGTFNGKPFILEPNQMYKLSLIWGFNKKESFKTKEEKGKGLIFVVKKFYDTETRKNGKSMFFAGVADFLVHNPFENDFKPEIYATGPLKDASRIIFDKAQDIARANPKLYNLFKRLNLRAFQTHSGGIIAPLAFEKASLEGRNPSLAIATEYHMHKHDTMIDSVESASNLSRINSLLVFDTTKGEGIYGVAYVREHDYKKLVVAQLEEPQEIIAPEIATFMAEVDYDDNPDDIDNPWETNPLRKSTPMIGVTVSLDSLQKEWAVAKLNPTRKREFLIKKFGKWIGNLQSIFSLDDFKTIKKKYAGKYTKEQFDGGNAIMSIDLANTGDTNAVTLIFKDHVDGKDIPIFIPKVFIPAKTLEMRVEKERKPYYDWIDKGLVETCGDASIDYKVIASYIKDCIVKYKINNIYFDPWNAHIIKTYLIDKFGVSESFFDEESEIKQNAKTLSSTMEDYIKRVVDADIYFFDNPVFIDHHINMKPAYNSQGQIYWTKQKQEQRIDIFSTCVTGMHKFNELKQYKEKTSNKMEVWAF